MDALGRWALEAPEIPLLGFVNSTFEGSSDAPGLLTPRELLEQVIEQTPTGIAVMQALELGVRQRGMSEVLAILTRGTPTTPFAVIEP